MAQNEQPDHDKQIAEMDHMQIGRLGFRTEGDFLNAYYAQPKTMDQAILLGSLRRAFLVNDAVREMWMSLMQIACADIIEGILGTRPKWGGEEPAPEHERTRTPRGH